MIITFIQRAIMQSIPLLFGSTGETITEKGGNLNLGIPGIMYVGGISGVIGAFFYEKSVETVNPFLAVLIPLLSSILGSALMGLLYCFLTVTLRANQNVTGLAMTTFGVGFGNFMGGSLIKLTGSEVPSIALSATNSYFSKSLPFASKLGWFGQIFLSYGFLAYLAVAIALIAQLNPIAAIFVALLFGILSTGGTMMQSVIGVPTAIVDIVRGLIIIFAVAGLAMVKLPKVKAIIANLGKNKKAEVNA